MPNIVKNTTFVSPLDLLFPHSCRGCGRIGEVFCERCKNYIIESHKDFCPNCKKEISTKSSKKSKSNFAASRCKNCPDLPPIYAVADRNGILGSLIHDYKYHSVRALAKPLAELVDSTLPKDLPENSVLVPLPTATHHIRARGFDHTLSIAKKLSKIRGYKIEKVLERNKNTVQVGSDRGKRLSQADSAYALNPKIKIDKEKTYILLDDVWTTGASVTSATNKLKRAGAKNIIVAILAYSA